MAGSPGREGVTAGSTGKANFTGDRLMYLPAHFQEKELDVIHQLVRDQSFGMLMVNGDQVPEVSHLPLHLKTSSNQDRILGHLALANPQAA